MMFGGVETPIEQARFRLVADGLRKLLQLEVCPVEAQLRSSGHSVRREAVVSLFLRPHVLAPRSLFLRRKEPLFQ